MKILVTGSEGRFGKILKKFQTKKVLLFKNKKQLDILSTNSINKCLKREKPNYILHLAGLSRPMSIHNKDISKSIDLNIIGTANVVKICEKYNIKLIYFSTNYIYPGKKGNYKELDPILPINKYAWSKLGGECSVKLYKNSLILRLSMCEKPFIHKYAFSDIKTNFMFHEDFVKILPKLLNKRGILNVGGKIQTIYEFAKKNNPRVKKRSGKKIFPPNPSMSISKLRKII